MAGRIGWYGDQGVFVFILLYFFKVERSFSQSKLEGQEEKENFEDGCSGGVAMVSNQLVHTHTATPVSPAI